MEEVPGSVVPHERQPVHIPHMDPGTRQDVLRIRLKQQAPAGREGGEERGTDGPWG